MRSLRTHGSYLLPVIALLVSAGTIGFEYHRRDTAISEIAATRIKFNAAKIRHREAVARYKLSMHNKQPAPAQKHH